MMEAQKKAYGQATWAKMTVRCNLMSLNRVVIISHTGTSESLDQCKYCVAVVVDDLLLVGSYRIWGVDILTSNDDRIAEYQA